MKKSTAILLGAVLVVAVGASFVASSHPDGLERVAADLGFEHAAAEPHAAPMPDYTVPGLQGPLSGSVAGVVGALAVGGLLWGAGRLFSRAS